MMHIGPPRVLIVEDDPDTLVIMRVNLRAAGIEPILASLPSSAPASPIPSATVPAPSSRKPAIMIHACRASSAASSLM